MTSSETMPSRQDALEAILGGPRRLVLLDSQIAPAVSTRGVDLEVLVHLQSTICNPVMKSLKSLRINRLSYPVGQS